MQVIIYLPISAPSASTHAITSPRTLSPPAFYFFFSSRRRHTRCSRDWSSDVCSSDLGALSTWSTIGNSNYHALTASLRTRLNNLTFDFNYTWSHSLDDASGLQSEMGYGDRKSVV